jgi:hypothetical protein
LDQAALKNQVKEPIPSLPCLQQLRKTGNGVINDGYLFFCQNFVKCVVGLQAFNRGIKNGLTFSEIASPSDEGLAYILLENSYKRWNAEYDDKARDNSARDEEQQEEGLVQGAEYTTAGKNKAKKGFTKKYCGWKQSGIEKFNQLVLKIRDDRVKHGKAFDEAFAKIKSRSKGTTSQEDDEMDETPVVRRVIRAVNDLEYPESDNEDESEDESGHDDESEGDEFH